jgi:hypothetical protein
MPLRLPAVCLCTQHRLGITRLNVYAGLAGFFMLRDSFPSKKPELPGIPFPPPGSGPDSLVRELPLAIQDRAFDINNQLYYPKQEAGLSVLPSGPLPPTWVPGAAGCSRMCSAVLSQWQTSMSNHPILHAACVSQC